jgi:ribonuclease HI
MGLGWVIGGVEYNAYVAEGHGNTNNVAEYRALICLLEAICDCKEPNYLRITGDSALVVNQVLGEWACHQPQLINLRDNVIKIIDHLEGAGWHVSISWVSRGFNVEADHASKAALLAQGIEPAMRNPEPGYTQRLGDIAEQCEISAIALGRVLDKLGLRNADKEPTNEALRDGYAQLRYDGRGERTDWNIEKVRVAIRVHHQATGFTHKIKRQPVLAEHICRHTVPIGLRPSRKRLEEVRAALCVKCQRGDTSLYKVEREEVLRICHESDSLVDAVELSTADLRLRPGVFKAAWGKWFHDKRESILNHFRGQCEKPGCHPAYLAQCAELEQQGTRDFERLIRAAAHSD